MIELRNRAGRTLPLVPPLVMGILNVTTDSFHDGGRYFDPEKAVERAWECVGQGADMLDIGAESSRPGSSPVSAETEIERVKQVFSRLATDFPLPISIDTTKASVAKFALEQGAGIVNDISACRWDPKMIETVRHYDSAVIAMHMQGKPLDMQREPFYSDVLEDVRHFLSERLEALTGAGIAAERIFLDPGIGFGKRLSDNLVLAANLPRLRKIGQPIVIGLSHKSFISSLLSVDHAGRFAGSLAANAIAAFAGADILRVHDVAEAKQAVTVAAALRSASRGMGD